MIEQGWALVWFVANQTNGADLQPDKKAPYLRAPGAVNQWTGNRLAAQLFATKEEAERARPPFWDPALFPLAHARVCWISRQRREAA